jgi:C2 domain
MSKRNRALVALALAGLIALATMGCGGGSAGSPSGTGDNGGSGGTSCNAGNCAGCCFNGACQAGVSDAACGRGGVVCQSCPTWQACSTQQSCAVDPSSSWSVVAVSLSLPTTDPSGADWDAFGGAPDPYAQCQIDGATVGTTSTVSDSFSATWDQTICPDVSASVLMTGQTWSICVWDADLTSDDLAGCWPTTFTEADFAGASSGQTIRRGLVVNNAPTGGELVLRLVQK